MKGNFYYCINLSYYFRAPLFEIEMWNCHPMLLEEVQMTTNSIESWHRVLNEQITGNKANVWQLIEALKKDEVLFRQKTLAEAARANYPTVSQDTRKKHDRMKVLLQRFETGSITILQLIQGLSRNTYY